MMLRSLEKSLGPFSSPLSYKDQSAFSELVLRTEPKTMIDNSSLHVDFLDMNISWYPEELELFENQSNFLMSLFFISILSIILVLGAIVHRAIFKLLNRLPQRAINQMIYPYMVRISNEYNPCKLPSFCKRTFELNTLRTAARGILQFCF